MNLLIHTHSANKTSVDGEKSISHYDNVELGNLRKNLLFDAIQHVIITRMEHHFFQILCKHRFLSEQRLMRKQKISKFLPDYLLAQLIA